MKNLLVLIFASLPLIAMELPINPLSPRSQEMAQQRAIINANRAEQQVFQDEATTWIADFESEVEQLRAMVQRLRADSPVALAPQIDAALLALNSQARLTNLHDQQIAALENTQQLQARMQIHHDADLQRRIAAAERSNYYLKWALGISTAFTTTVFSLMGYLLWKNQQRIAEESKIIVDRNHKGEVIRFGQNRSVALQIAIPQPISNSSATQPAPKAAPAAPQPTQSSQPAAVQTSAAPVQPLPQYATREQIQAVSERIDEVNARIPQLARVMDRDGNIFLEYTDAGQQPRSGHSSYVGEFWPPKGFNEKLKK